MEHARLAPSTAPIWVPCPGSVQLQEKYPELTESESAKEGTAAHWVASEVLKSYVEVNRQGGINSYLCSELIGATAPNGIIITEEMAESANVYVMDVLKVAQETGGLRKLHIEERVQIPRVNADNWGTPDAWLFDEKTGILYIWDFKHGHKYVDVVKNWQLLDYGIGVFSLIQDYAAQKITNMDEFVQVDFRVVQPCCFMGAPVRTWKIKASDLRGYANILSHSAEKALQQEPPTKTGPHCKYCTARHACTGAQLAAMNAVDVGLNSHTNELNPASLGMEIKLLRKAVETITNRLDGLEAVAEAKIKQGVHVPGWMLQQGYGRKIWNKKYKLVVALGEMFGIDLRKPEELLTPAQAIKKGIDEKLVNVYSERPKRGLKLVEQDPNLAKKIFGD